MSQQQNGLLGMIHQFVCKARLIIADQRDAVLARNIFRGDDYEFIPRDAGTERDLLDPSAGNLAVNGRSEEHVGQYHVVDVLRPSSHLVAPFLARNRLADDGICVHNVRA